MSLTRFIFCCRLSGDSRGVSLPRDRRSSFTAAEGGPSNGHYEHQTRPRIKDLRSDQLAQGLVARSHASQYLDMHCILCELDIFVTGWLIMNEGVLVPMIFSNTDRNSISASSSSVPSKKLKSNVTTAKLPLRNCVCVFLCVLYPRC